MERSYLTHEETARRYPRLLRAMRWAACLADLEAQSAIIMHRAGHDCAGEAVNHFGGCLKVIRAGIRCRNVTSLGRRAKAITNTMADRVERQYADNRRAEGAWRAAAWTQERIDACRAMQDAYVAYVRAFGIAYPDEAHLLPDMSRGRLLPEWRTAREASDRYEAIAKAESAREAA